MKSCELAVEVAPVDVLRVDVELVLLDDAIVPEDNVGVEQLVVRLLFLLMKRWR